MPNSFAFSTLNLPGLSFSSNKYENAVIEWFAFAAWIKNLLFSYIIPSLTIVIKIENDNPKFNILILAARNSSIP